MAQKFIIKQKTGEDNFIELYPKTSADIVEATSNGKYWNTVQGALDKLNTIYSVWAADSDTEDPHKLVNKVEEILEIFNTYPEGDKILTSLNGKLSLSGGDMTGHINMGKNNITNFDTIQGSHIGKSNAPITNGYFQNLYSTNVGTSTNKITDIHADTIRTTNIGKDNGLNPDGTKNIERVTNIYATNLDVLSFKPTSITTQILNVTTIAPKDITGKGVFTYDSSSSRWRIYNPMATDGSQLNNDDRDIIIRKDISNFASKTTPKYFSATTEDETIAPNTGAWAAFSAVSVNSEGIVTAYGQSIITGKGMDTGTLAEWGLYFSFIED